MRPATFRMCAPTGGLPVKETLAGPGCRTSASPVTSPGPCTSSMTPSGRPASRKHSAIRMAVSGVSSAGFSTSVFPAASAGPTLCATRFSGKLNGVIADDDAERRRGGRSRRVPRRSADASIGTVSPWIRLASSPANVNVSTLRATSPAAYFQAFPASRAMSVVNSSLRARMRSAAPSRMADRRWAGVAAQAGNARWARPTAASTSAASATGSVRMVSPVNLSITSRAATGQTSVASGTATRRPGAISPSQRDPSSVWMPNRSSMRVTV